MDKITRYKSIHGESDKNLTITSSGKVIIPKWLQHLLVDQSGLKTRKKRIFKKVLKKQIIKLIQAHLKNE